MTQNQTSVSSGNEPRPLRVAWINDYPLEWMDAIPSPLRHLRRQHPATWQMVLLGQLRQRADIELHVLVLRSAVRDDFSFRQDNVTFHVLKSSSLFRAASFFWSDTLRIRSALGKIAPDLVHAWGTERAAALMGSRLALPALVSMQGILTWIHQVSPLHKTIQKMMVAIEPISLRRARVITAESRFGVDYLSARYPKARVLQAEHAPNPLFSAVIRTPPSTAPLLIALGSASRIKGTDLLLQAIERLGDDFRGKLLLIGSVSTEFLNGLKSAVGEATWSKVETRQGLTPAQVAERLAGATLLVHPSRVDNSPNAVKEAAVAGVPVVASRIGAIPDYIKPGQNGLLVEPGDLDGLTAALRQALGHPLFGRGHVDPGSLMEVRSYLSAGQMADNFLAAYRTALEAWSIDTRQWPALS
jgi:glycosyltransferase involved in cell wall biosynthesis